MVNTLLVAIDDIINRQLNLILHHPTFQKMEASWRGISYLVDRKQTGTNTQIRVLDLAWSELSRDVLNAIDFDQSQLFKKIYTNEFDQPGGYPFGLLICDYFVNPRYDETSGNDIYTLNALAGIAAAAFSPCVLGLDALFFGIKQLTEMELLVDFSGIFNSQSYTKWKKLCRSADARFLNLTLVRFSLRTPYQLLDDRLDGFCFREIICDHNDYLWGNTVYCLAAIVLRSFQQTGWFYEIKGIRKDTRQGGMVEDLVTHYFKDDINSFYAKPSCEVALKHAHESNIYKMGIIPLSRCPYSNACVFYTCSTQYEEHLNLRNRLSLDTVLSVSRFAHYIKSIARQKIGSTVTSEILQNYLQNWLQQYISIPAGDMTPEFAAKYPLYYGNISVRERKAKPGYFDASFHLKPHHFKDQIDENLYLEMSLS